MTTFKLEFSEDDLSVSNAACTKVDVTDLLKSNTLRYSGGIDRLGDPPRDGVMSFTLRGRDFEPLNAESPYYPNVVRRRRFFLSVLRGATYQPEFVGYARTFQPTWPGSVLHQEVEVVCGDGADVLANARLPGLDPPEAQTYEDVAMHDAPFAFYTGNDVDGTQLKAETGPDMVIVGRPLVKQPGLVVGDPGFSIRAGAVPTAPQYFRTPIEAGQFGDTNKISVGGWFKPIFTGANIVYLRGPRVASSDNAFTLKTNSSDRWEFQVVNAAGLDITVESTTTISTGRADFVFGTWDGQTASLYVNGALEDSFSFPMTIGTGASELFIWISTSGSSPPVFYWQKAEFHETCLSADRILARWEAGSGFPQQTAGERIEAAADLDLWDTSEIQTAGFDVIPAMKTGQSPLSVIEEAMRAEGKRTLLGWRGNGDPFYLGWEWMADTPYDEPQATFGAPAHRADGEVHYDAEAVHFDDEVYTQTTKSRVGGLAHTETVVAPTNEEAVAEPETELILVNDADVALLCSEHLSIYGEPGYVLDSLDLHSSDEEQETLMFDLGMGDRVRFKRYTEDEDGLLVLGLDLATHIIGFEKRWGEGDIVTCTWNLARGFDAAEEVWRLSMAGYSELDGVSGTTVLA